MGMFLVALCHLTNGVHAQTAVQAPGTPTFQVEPEIDLPLLAIAAGVAFGWTLWSEQPPAHCAPRCDESTVWSVDRFAAGWYRPRWQQLGHVGVASVFALSGLTLLIDEGPKPAMVDSVIVAQSVMGALAVSIMVNTATRRPRPFMYGDVAPAELRQHGYASLSYFSGHTANAFAATLATYQTLQRRHPNRHINHFILLVGLVGSTFVGASRVVSGHHFLSDVVTGAVVGSAMGIMVPALHRSPLALHAGVSGLTLSYSMR